MAPNQGGNEPMGLVVATGLSTSVYSESAASEAIQQATKKLAGREPQLALIFASIQYDQEKLVKTVSQQLPSAQVIGMSTAGQITEQGPSKKSLAVFLLSGDNLRTQSFAIPDATHQPREAGKTIANQIKQSFGQAPKLLLILGDGLSLNATAVDEGIKSVFGNDFLYAGAMAGDDFLFKKTYQYHGSNVYSGALVAIAVDGQFQVGYGSAHGWQRLGLNHKVTRSTGNRIDEIDGRPAINLYESYFGKEAVAQIRNSPMGKLFLTYPFGYYHEVDQSWIVRTPLAVDKNGNIFMSGPIPHNAAISLMIGDRNEALTAAGTATTQAISSLNGHPPQAVICFDSAARNRLLGTHASEEIRRMTDAIKTPVALFGGYSYAELIPAGINKRQTECQNASVGIVAIGGAV